MWVGRKTDRLRAVRSIFFQRGLDGTVQLKYVLLDARTQSHPTLDPCRADHGCPIQLVQLRRWPFRTGLYWVRCQRLPPDWQVLPPPDGALAARAPQIAPLPDRAACAAPPEHAPSRSCCILMLPPPSVHASGLCRLQTVLPPDRATSKLCCRIVN